LYSIIFHLALECRVIAKLLLIPEGERAGGQAGRQAGRQASGGRQAAAIMIACRGSIFNGGCIKIAAAYSCSE
jgi:hypothetical protein